MSIGQVAQGWFWVQVGQAPFRVFLETVFSSFVSSGAVIADEATQYCFPPHEIIRRTT